MALNEVEQGQSSDDDEYGKLIRSLNQALSAAVNYTDPTDPQAIEFKRQIESGNLPVCAESDPEKEEIINEWVYMYRDELDAVFAEIKFFKGRN